MKLRGALQTDYNSERVSFLADTGTVNSFAVTLRPSIPAYVEGLRLRFRASNTNTAGCTMNINGLGAKPIKKQVSLGLLAGDIQEGQVVELAYDGVNFQLTSDLTQTLPSTLLNEVLPVKVTLLADGSYEIPAGRRLKSLTITPSVTSNLKVGKTDGGDEIMMEESVGSGEDIDIDYTMTCRAATTIYFSGITASTVILVYSQTLTPVNP